MLYLKDIIKLLPRNTEVELTFKYNYGVDIIIEVWYNIITKTLGGIWYVKY